MLTLHGCGGGGSGGDGKTTKTTQTTTHTTTPATTSITSTRTAPGGLRYCEDISTFYKVNEANGTKYAVGQCLPSKSPGAYYTKSGEKDPNDPKSDRQWMCFSPDFEKSLWTDEEARKQDPPFEGACLFADFNNKAKPVDVEDCSNHLSHHPAVCSPGPSQYWGACWSSTSEQWKCIPNKDDTIPGLAKGDCKAQVVLHEDGTPTTSFYDGACRFKEEKVVKYRCDTVPGYDAGDATTCGGGSPPDNACFTLNKGANWQCFQKDQNSTTPCDWTLLDGKKEFYKGACVFKGNADYQNATDAHNLSTVIKSFFI
jgi:hypothetical protein